MMNERRHYPRVQANVLWRAAGLRAPRAPSVDMSLGGMLVYSDEPLDRGARLEIEILLPDEDTIEVEARVVRVDVMPTGSPARFDVALEFLGVRDEARARLARQLARWLGEPASEARVDEQEPEEVHGVEHQHGDQRLAEAPTSAPLSRGPDRDSHVREQNRDQEDLLHRSSRSQAQPTSTRNDGGAKNGRFRVLFVTPYLPSPPRFGGQQRLHGLISGLAASHEVSVLSLVDPNEDQSESLRATEAYCRDVVAVPNRRCAGGLKKRLWQLGSLLSTRSYERIIHREDELDSALDLLLERERYHVVHFEFPHMATYRINGERPTPRRPSRFGRERPQTPALLLDEHNIEHDLARQAAVAGRSALRRAYNAINARKVQKEELRVWSRFDGCTLTSARDEGRLLADAPETRTAVVPNGVDLDFFRPGVTREAREPDNLLFFGAIDYYPNTDAMLFFARDVLPLLRERVPRVRLSIVGRRPPESVIALRSDDVDVTGAVEDVRPHLDRAAVVIAPLRMGGGTRLKIIEALSMGKAVVSTSIGAEGLDVVPERDLLLADDPETFAAQIRRLLDDPDLADRIGASGRRVVEARYGWRASVERLSAFYGEIIDAHGIA